MKPLEVNFSNESEGDNLSYFWEFEYGTPAYSTEENPTVLYEQLGKFRVSLTINNGTDESIVKEDYIEVLPDGVPPIAGCAPSRSTYTSHVHVHMHTSPTRVLIHVHSIRPYIAPP